MRQQQAELTRSKVVSAAAELFSEHGYARTTLAKIAEAAGVSPETVQGHGPKAALMIAAVEYAAIGVSDEEDVLNVEAGRRFVATQSPDEAIDYFVAAQTEIHQLTARIAPALRDGAAADAELRSYLQGLLRSINQQLERLLGVARERGWLRRDVPFEELVETLAVISSTDSYLRITQQDGWPVDRYRGWLRRMIAESVFGHTHDKQ
ncbi:TetR/AcrR family transcriptional regulator [Mycobacterium intermedium]|uniref:TetR/AcrR family transcriptional regulator n=1 Tax=Mycobacterium intermedium TaxID=28445 RepID=UPI0039EA38BD